MCQMLVWMLGLLHWSKHIKMSAFSRLRSSVSRKHYSSIWIQEFWLLGYKVVIVISRCHEMQSLLDINQNLMNYKQLNVKQLGDICVFWLLPECCDWVINLVWYSMSWARNWKEVGLELEQLGSSTGSAIYCTYALGKLLNLSEPQFLYL